MTFVETYPANSMFEQSPLPRECLRHAGCVRHPQHRQCSFFWLVPFILGLVVTLIYTSRQRQSGTSLYKEYSAQHHEAKVGTQFYNVPKDGSSHIVRRFKFSCISSLRLARYHKAGKQLRRPIAVDCLCAADMEMGDNQVQTRPLNHESNAEVQIMKEANHETIA